jgi:hypothetical protein
MPTPMKWTFFKTINSRSFRLIDWQFCNPTLSQHVSESCGITKVIFFNCFHRASRSQSSSVFCGSRIDFSGRGLAIFTEVFVDFSVTLHIRWSSTSTTYCHIFSISLFVSNPATWFCVFWATESGFKWTTNQTVPISQYLLYPDCISYNISYFFFIRSGIV